MPSGAGHDAQNLARLAPTGMIFVPSVQGRSHSPAELTTWDDIENGANVLLAAVHTLATGPDGSGGSGI
jgi:N-carbamoyl-L-amino-acid hydrolase